MENLVFDSVEKWAVRFTEGFIDGRHPMEDQIRIDDFVSRLTHPHIIPRELPSLQASAPTRPFYGDRIRAGPFHDLLSLKIPDKLADLLGLPRDTGQPQIAKVTSIKSSEPVFVNKIPTCTDRNIFVPMGRPPPHPEIKFFRPVNHVHVRLVNALGKMLWDASYDLKGGRFLDAKITDAIPGESQLPDFIPPCAVGRGSLQLQIDAEQKGPMKIDFYNPVSHKEFAKYREEMLRARPPGTKIPQTEIERSDATICKINKPHPMKEVLKDTSGKKSNVHIPPSLERQLWRFDKTREESSDLNPHGMPMMDLSGGRVRMGPVLDPELAKMAPMAIGSGKQAVHLIPRRPELGGEIQVDQLERENFHIFDSRKMPTEIKDVDRGVISGQPKGLIQPTVKKTVYSPMWQGVHGPPKTPLHPSFQFKHPASIAHVQLADLTQKKILWDAYFDVGGHHKIAADQAPVGGAIPKFEGLNPATGVKHEYSFKVDVDNPADKVPAGIDPIVKIWRHSEFLFGAQRPVTHANVNVLVTNEGAPPSRINVA
jgi:hypothetical protein